MNGVTIAASKAVEAARPSRLLFVGPPSLHTEVLAQYLSGALYATFYFCQQQSDFEETSEDALVLIDCQQHDYDEIVGRLEYLYETEPTSRVVLLNAGLRSQVDKLIQWPCLKGIFFEDCNRELLLKGMRSVLRGGIWMPRRIIEESFERHRMAMSPRRGLKTKLSLREQDILRCIARADTNADIASKLYISEHTVKSHIYNIFRKIDVRNRTEASHWAMLHLPPDK